jgi:histidyl-tRNA synthetase
LRLATSQYFSLLSEIRSEGKAVDLYPAIAKMDKQLTYADKAGYSYAIIIGENELNTNQITIKDLKQRQQTTLDRNRILDAL